MLRSLLLTSSVAAVLFSQVACEKHNQIRLQISANDSKVSLVVQRGDVITWADTPAEFKIVDPCAEDKKTSVCTVNRDKGLFRYNCQGCEDPEIVVGSEEPFPPIKAASRKPFDIEINIACVNDTVIVERDKENANDGKVIKWIPVGGTGEYLATWELKFTNNICEDSSTINQDNPYCKVKAPPAVPNTDYGYTVSSNSCRNPGTAIVRIP
jgi:hypothetical protein